MKKRKRKITTALLISLMTIATILSGCVDSSPAGSELREGDGKTEPGFTAVFAIAGLLAVAYLTLRQRDKKEKIDQEEEDGKKRGHG